jgi:hypothetical protein
MATGGIDLKTLLEHDLRMAQSILDTSRKLVLELEAAHYWTTTSIDSFKSLANICTNVNAMLDVCEAEWQGGTKPTGKIEEQKLWQTAVGLYRALPAEQRRFTEQVTRRRRERIMGEGVPEDVELEDEVREQDNRAFTETANNLSQALESLLNRAATLPVGLEPPAEQAGQASAAKAPAAPELEIQQQQDQAPATPEPAEPESGEASAGDIPL